MHGKYGDREAALQAAALEDDMDGRSRRRAGAAWRKLIDSRKPAPPAGHATRQHYDTALLRFERGNHSPSMQWVGVDAAGGPGTAAVVTYTRTGSTVRIDTVFSAPAFPNVASTGLPTWLASTESASGAALIGAKPAFAPGRRVRVLPHPEHGRHPRPFIGLMNNLIGKRGTVVGMEDGSVVVHMDEADVRIFFPPSALAIEAGEADTPAPAAQELARALMYGNRWYIHTGGQNVVAFECDADGWISHTPTADAACPIPVNTAAEVRFRDGDVHESLPNEAWRWNHEGTMGDIVAWRPVTQA